VLPTITERFIQEYPGIVVRVDDVPSTALELLRDRRHDLIVARMVRPLGDDADFNVETLFEDQLVVAADHRNRWARRRNIDVAELVNEPWLLSPPDTWAYQRLAEAFQARGLGMPKVCVMTLSVHLRNHLLAGGRLLSAFPRSIAIEYSQKILPVDLPVRPWPVVMVTLKNRTLSPIVERFIECAREVMKPTAGRQQARKR